MSFHSQHGTKYSVQQKLMEEPNYYNREKPPLLAPWTRCHKLAQKESKGMTSFKNCHHYCQQAGIQTVYHKTVAVQSDVQSFCRKPGPIKKNEICKYKYQSEYIMKVIIIIIFLHGLGRLTCSSIDILLSFPGASMVSSSSRFVVEGVFWESGVVHSLKVVDPVLFVFESDVLYSRNL